MQYFYLYIAILLCFIVAVSYWTTYNTIEAFNPDNDIFILLGDSILQNGLWVSEGKAIDFILHEKTKGKTISLAVDGSKIVDVYSQINDIPNNIDNKITTVFLSVGGNDILEYVENNSNDINENILIPMFTAYKKVVNSIKARLPNANIVLLDIYYLDNLKYKKYHNIIEKWNNFIYKYATDKQNGIEAVLKISNILTKPEDFTFGIEPSSTGGLKIVNEIMSTY